MKKHLIIYKTFDVVVVPFPFIDTMERKNRPALVLSSNNNFNKISEKCILAMITSAQNIWPSDTIIEDLNSCGLHKPSLIRLKLFTFDNALIKDKIGALSKKDQKKVQKNFFLAFNDIIDIE